MTGSNSKLGDLYVNNTAFMSEYVRYQERYFSTIRKSDLVLIGLVEQALKKLGKDASLLDAACSTGGLLFHLRKAFPDLRLVGGDLSDTSIAKCLNDTRFKDVDFDVMDICDLKSPQPRYDIVIANAVFYLFGTSKFSKALNSIKNVLKPGGVILMFDFFHPYHHELEIIEYSERFPDGQPIHQRSYDKTNEKFLNNGFGMPTYLPFEIPIDLPDPGLDPTVTRTVTTIEGFRLPFRGTLYQPWCHLIAEKED